jgi:hypothetical protein
MQIDAGVCRRLNGESCEFGGSHVPTTLSVINSWSSQLGPIVVIVDGYNDLPANFPGDVELTLNTLRAYGVQHVLWLNLHDTRPEFTAKNAVLSAAARHHQELRVLDWNSFSSPHLEWYQTDWIHLRPEGGVAIATWIRQAIADTLSPRRRRRPLGAQRSPCPRTRRCARASAFGSIGSFVSAPASARCAGGRRARRCAEPGFTSPPAVS